jgi:exo-beta-1,3-glucanase (GH17 family)
MQKIRLSILGLFLIFLILACDLAFIGWIRRPPTATTPPSSGSTSAPSQTDGGNTTINTPIPTLIVNTPLPTSTPIPPGLFSGQEFQGVRTSTTNPNASLIYFDNYQVLVRRRVNGVLQDPQPYKAKAVCWSPAGINERGDTGQYPLHYSNYHINDINLMVEMNVNTVRTYDRFELNQRGLAVLDYLHSKGIMVVMQVFSWYGDASTKNYLNTVRFFKDHPAILAWQVGNEFAYNNLYGANGLSVATQMIKTAVDEIKSIDPDHPVTVGVGDPADSYSRNIYNQIPGADMWSFNIYPGLSGMGGKITHYHGYGGNKPMFIAEYGADAYNSTTQSEDQASQANANTILTNALAQYYSANNKNHPVLGGAVFAFSDEWWKSGNYDRQDTGGFVHGGVPPDGYANEEWWGLVKIDRTKRQAFFSMRDLYATL